MKNRLRTVASEDGEWAKPEDLVRATLAPIRPWRPSRMKTGLRNRSIGRKVYVVAPRRVS
jgi:hypothetical protein